MVECVFKLCSQYYPSQNSPPVQSVKAAKSDNFRLIGWCTMSENSCTIADVWSDEQGVVL